MALDTEGAPPDYDSITSDSPATSSVDSPEDVVRYALLVRAGLWRYGDHL